MNNTWVEIFQSYLSPEDLGDFADGNGLNELNRIEILNSVIHLERVA